MDLLVSRCVGCGTQVAFRFYPHSEPYQSPLSTTVSFNLRMPLPAGSFLRLAENVDVAQMVLLWRQQWEASWTAAADAPSAWVPRPASPSVFVSFCTPATSCKPVTVSAVCALGIALPASPPTFPPECVLACRYSITAASAEPTPAFVYSPGQRVPGHWDAAWQTLRWAGGWATGVANYAATVELAENNLGIQVLPGQMVPVAFRPYDVVLNPQFPAAAGFVVTSCIPAHTVVQVWCNAWDAGNAASTAWLTWTAGNQDVPPGRVVAFYRFGGDRAPLATCGTLTNGATFLPLSSIHSLTLFARTASGTVLPCTGIYTCAYTGVVPVPLQTGQSIREAPWPNTASIACVDVCARTPDWPGKLNRVPLARWVDQPMPGSVVVTPCIEPRACGAEPGCQVAWRR